jgi:cation transport ATPase
MLAASLEKSSEHPLAAAIVVGAGERDIELMEPENFNSHTGRGVSGRVNGKQILLGNAKLLEEFEVDAASIEEDAKRLRAEGRTAMFVAVDGKAAGLVSLSDPIKESTPEAIDRLHEENVKVIFFAFVYNTLGVPIDAGVLYPVFGLLLSPMIAAAAMSFSSVSVVGNALRLRRIDI